MVKRTLKPKRKTSLSKKIQRSNRKNKSKRLRSRGNRMSDKALSRSRLKQKKSKRRGKILRGGVRRKNPNPMRAQSGDERTQSALRRKGLRDAKIAKERAEAVGKRFRGVVNDPQFDELRKQLPENKFRDVVEAGLGHNRIRKRVANRKREQRPISDQAMMLPVDLPADRPDAPETAAIVKAFSDEEAAKLPETYLERVALDALRGVSAPLLGMSANFLENPRENMRQGLNYARYGVDAILGDRFGATAALEAASAARGAAAQAAQAAQAATRAALASIDSGRASLAGSLRRSAEDLAREEPMTFVGQELLRKS